MPYYKEEAPNDGYLDVLATTDQGTVGTDISNVYVEIVELESRSRDPEYHYIAERGNDENTYDKLGVHNGHLQDRKNNSTSNRKKKILCALCIGIMIVAIIAVAVFVILKVYTGNNSPKDNGKQYYIANSAVIVATTFSPFFTQKSSREYNNFSNEFCEMIGGIIQRNLSYTGYHKCTVTDLRNISFSVLVLYDVYFTKTERISSDQLKNHILSAMVKISSDTSTLGNFIVFHTTLHINVIESISPEDNLHTFSTKALITTKDNMVTSSSKSLITTPIPAVTASTITMEHELLSSSSSSSSLPPTITTTTSELPSSTTTKCMTSEGSTPVLTILPDFYESFPRLGDEHTCKTNNLGYPSEHRYLQIEIADANISRVFTYDKNTPEHLKSFNDGNNVISVSITETDKLLIASDVRSNSTCLDSQKIKFLLNLTYAWNGGHIRCILKDDVRGEIIDDKYTINMIPANYCGGAGDNTYKLHPDNDCHRYVQCSGGYSYGKTCHNLCINTQAGTCDHCTDDLECRGTTTTTTTTAATTKAMVPGILVCLTTNVFAGETAIITCNLTNDNFNFINISKVLSGNDTEIATIMQDGTISKRSGHSLGKYGITYTQSTSVLTVRIQNIRCEDQSQYRFAFDDGTLSPSVTLTAIITKAKPEVPKLTISPDLVENQNKRIHTCEANVGNPAGYLQLEIRYPSFKNFTVYSSSDKMLQETTENCKTIHTLSFAIDLSEDVNGSAFRCVSKNDKTTNKSDQIQSSSEYVITVIPSDYCTGVASNVFKEYPGKDCHKYILCHQNNAFGRTCNTLCWNAGICDYCYKVPNCEKVTTEESTTKTTKATTTTTMSSSSVSTTQANVQLICATTNAFEGEIGVIACNATFDSFKQLNISKATSGNLATVLADGTVHESQGVPVGKYEFSYSRSTKVFNLKIKNFHCVDEGQYQLTLENNIGSMTEILPNIYLKVKPKVPMMRINPHLVENRKDILHTCEGDVGNPGGYLQLEIKRPSSNSFVKYQSPLPKTVKSNCSNIESLLFAIDLTENLNGSLIRCVAINDEANEKSDKIQSSQEFRIAVIPSDFCSDQGDNWFEHPLGCPYYVRCAGRLFTGECVTQNCRDIQDITCDINPSGK